MKRFLHLIPVCIIFAGVTDLYAQCATTSSIHTFSYEGKTYEVVKENKTWVAAAACAVERGGYLAEINSAEEQEAIFNEIANAQINPEATVAPDGYSSYVWLGGNDIAQEGKWIWNGNNDGESVHFWQGTANGSVIGGLYNNWGNEPDNSAPVTGQDGLGLAILDWPLGEAGQWNDLNHNDALYYIIEYNIPLNGVQFEKKDISVYPNPIKGSVFVKTDADVKNIVILNAVGQEVKTVSNFNQVMEINLEDLRTGVYFLRLYFSNGNVVIKQIVKE